MGKDYRQGMKSVAGRLQRALRALTLGRLTGDQFDNIHGRIRQRISDLERRT